MNETTTEFNLFEYSSLLQLAENFSENGVLNLNFLRSLLVQVVKTLKQFDDARVNDSKLPWPRESNKAGIVDKESQSGIESMHDSLSKVSESKHFRNLDVKPNELSTKLSFTAECQSLNETKYQAALSYKTNCCFQTQSKSIEFCELPLTTVEQTEVQLKFKDRIMGEVDSKIIKLESNVRGVTTVASDIVNEMEKIESKLMADSFEISKVKNSIEQLRQEFLENLQNPKEKASKFDGIISSTTLVDEEFFPLNYIHTSSNNSHVGGFQCPNEMQQKALMQTNPIKNFFNETCCTFQAHFNTTQEFPLLNRSQSSMYMNITESDENQISKDITNQSKELHLQIESIQNQLSSLKSKINLLETSKFSEDIYQKFNLNETNIQQSLNSLENVCLKSQSEFDKVYKEIKCVNAINNTHSEDIIALKSDVNIKLENAKSEILNEMILIGTELKREQQREMDELLKTFNVSKDELQQRLVSIENVMATKADYNVMQQKVSLEYFDATKRSLTSSMLELITQLSARENDWQQSLNEMNQIIESKLNKDEILLLKDHLNKKVDCIQDRLKSLNLLKRETEAAGTKYRLLKGVKCISCDSNAMMKVIETSSIPWKGPLSKRITQKHFITKLNEQINLKTDVKRATMQNIKMFNEKRGKSSMEQIMPSINKIEK